MGIKELELLWIWIKGLGIAIGVLIVLGFLGLIIMGGLQSRRGDEGDKDCSKS